MKATTMKLDGELLRSIEKAKPASQSVTSYVRQVLRKELTVLKLREAAAEYRVFLESEPDERRWLEEWEKADLASDPAAGPRAAKKKP